MRAFKFLLLLFPLSVFCQDAFEQPYRYLNAGGQCEVFISEDERYVIKFFRQEKFALPLWVETLSSLPLFESYATQKRKKKELKRERFYTAFQVSFERFAEETGLVYVHLHPTDHLNRTLRIRDAQGKEREISLDTSNFIVQRKAELLDAHLQALLEKNEIAQAAQAIEQLLELIFHFYQSGLRDRDPNIVNNYGFIDGKPVLFDVGRVITCRTAEEKKKSAKKLSKTLAAFRSWIDARYPSLAPCCDAAIAKILENIYTP